MLNKDEVRAAKSAFAGYISGEGKTAQDLAELYLSTPEGWPTKRKEMEKCHLSQRGSIDVEYSCEVRGYNSALDAAHLVYVRDMAEKDREIAELKDKIVKTHESFCDVCWTSSWAPVPKDYPNAQKVIDKDEYVICQMCEADRKLAALKSQVQKVSAEEIEKALKQWGITEELGFRYKLATTLADKFNGGKEEPKP